jgi:hypothetical protein
MRREKGRTKEKKGRWQTRSLQKNQTKETAKTPHWHFRRPFLGHGDRRFPKILRKPLAHLPPPGLPNCEV